jgi:hypothetical protein
MAVITVDWKHILLDPDVFNSHKTHRVARIPGGLSAFPVQNRGYWVSDDGNWPGSSGGDGAAPPYYIYNNRKFNFGFWSIKEDGSGSISDGINLSITTKHPLYIYANAFYYWDFGGGPGSHAVYLDAFDTTNQVFIPDDFVDVIPDNSSRDLTALANNGMLITDDIKEAIIRARTPLTNLVADSRNLSEAQMKFLKWWNMQDLRRSDPNADPNTVPTINDGDIDIKQGSVISALAAYDRGDPKNTGPNLNWTEGGYIEFGTPSDGLVILLPPGRGPIVIGPWGPRNLRESTEVGVEKLTKRIEALEKQLLKSKS